VQGVGEQVVVELDHVGCRGGSGGLLVGLLGHLELFGVSEWLGLGVLLEV